jgi:hypothetical protein
MRDVIVKLYHSELGKLFAMMSCVSREILFRHATQVEAIKQGMRHLEFKLVAARVLEQT